MFQIEELSSLRTELDKQKSKGTLIGLVPTMGALHQGHLSLVHQAKKEGLAPIATIFVNPTQFAAHEDLDTYPSTLQADLDALKEAGAAGVWMPKVSTMYPGLDATRLQVTGDLTDRWEGEFRPHFFTGVATVVAKLLIASMPHKAYFGEKDFQQLQVIKALANDLLLPTQIVGCPTIRAEDGLALSSRNTYLSVRERAIAPALHQALVRSAAKIRKGQSITSAKNEALTALGDVGFGNVDYFSIVEANSLTEIETFHPASDSRILAAAYLGTTRLIDNIKV